MVQLKGGTDAAIRMDQLSLADLFSGSFHDADGTSFSVTGSGGVVTDFDGNGFTYNGSGAPTAGTVRDIDYSINGDLNLSINGLQSDAAQLYADATSGHGEEALAQLFSGHDNMRGTAFDDVLDGGAGNDNVFGGGGADTLHGGSGNDHVFGFSGSGGDDGADDLFGDEGNDYLQGNRGDDLIDGGTGSDRINGGADNDTIIGGEGNDTVNGNRGNDSIDGGTGNDVLRGGQGNDSISGGEGNDVIRGDLGSDTLSGGADADYFVFERGSSLSGTGQFDTISDFEEGVDHIQIGYTPTAILTGAAQSDYAAASLFAQQLFDGHAGNGEVASVAVGSDTYLFFSDDEGSNANSAILLSGVSADSITVADF
ncbi:calcium-binding protein [Sphingomonas sp. C8-2]|uniref:Hemolysin-type calcium-binding repeat-containing protein n=1 Tax=Rhizorhabdus histidinilytica TaxID=439228 RepID=A0A1T5GTQ5_9SPHN|nr:calcium-binding protein [Rhizorhabdus histidinilytica]QEH77837.1 calcium-binding protein [Sphingomonas sp. C8-2]SKC11803.1 Hemolysin-type calcium-binding repeat-containing protein [Rhizorhabdus histidinilytica]